MDQPTDLKARVQQLLDTAINPAVAGHGGSVELIDVKDNKVFLQLSGGCQGCASSTATLRMGIERLIKEQIPEIQEVIDATDHAGGLNPYFTADQ